LIITPGSGLGIYHHYLFPWLLDLAMASPMLREPRSRTLAPARGRVLEIGFGTGRNLTHYPPTVKRIEAIDPDPDLDRLSLPRIAHAAIAVDFHHLNAEHLPFEDARFDTVVSTFTLCSIPDVVHALGEVRRVLKPGGQFLFLEHGRSPDASVARWQDRLNRAWMPLAGGCHLNRPMRELITDAGLEIGPAQNYYLERAPKFIGYVTEGMARRGDGG
jgi:ubiquinone/menaquinone biosynthesis C-methylase UbiE